MIVGYRAWQLHQTQPISQTTPQATKSPQAASPSATPKVTSNPYSGWATFDYKNLFSFKYPAGYHYSDVGEGANTVAVTSYTFNPNGAPTDLHCAAQGYNVPDCDVKIELSLLADGTVRSVIYPASTKLKPTADLIIASVKKD